MFEHLSQFTQKLGWKIHGFALGMTLALGASFMGGGCVASGQ